MTKRRSLLLALILVSGLLLSRYFFNIVFFFLFLPPETFGDMNTQIESLELPDNFRLVAKRQRGLRSGFMGGSPPSVTRQYAVSWEPSAVCDQIDAFAQGYDGEPVHNADQFTCGARFTVESGFVAKLLGVVDYSVSITAIEPENLRLSGITDADCEKNDAAVASSEDPLAARLYQCVMGSNEGLVTLSLSGKQG